MSELRQRCTGAEDIGEELGREYDAISELYSRIGPVMEPNAELMFSNHVICLLKRIKTGEYVPPMDESLFSGLSEKAIDLARRLVADAFNAAGETPDKTEVLMLATHLEVALENEGKGDGCE